ncbi:MAG: proteasome accessory factor PafA2 family protein [Candidatus Aenigmarchaeota archaeon]|nr:proteasome accessory factor PafA2 family protein [Candidatus Aenigmarchaeota archaeon]
MHRRIYGTELEYGMFSWELVPKHLTISDFMSKVGDIVNHAPALLNGGRLYKDAGDHPEYSTPECLTPLEVVLYEKAGERILEEIFKHGFDIDGVKGSAKLYRTAVDKKEHTHGYHENYLVDRKIPLEYLTSQMIPFLVTRVIYAGSGFVDKEFMLSGRAMHIYHESGPTTNVAGQRAIYNTRDEPHADTAKYRRLHLIVGDPNMSEYSTFLKIGATSLMLDLVDDGLVDLEIENPVETLHTLSRLYSVWPIKLKNGKTISAIDLQREYLSKAQKHFSSGCENDCQYLHGMNSDILKLWEKTLGALEKNPMILSDQLDWVIELKMLDAKMKQKNLSIEDPLVSMLDLKYHEIGEKSLFYMLQNKDFVRRLLSDVDIEKAMTTPPNTRAKGRSLIIKKMKERGKDLLTNHTMSHMWNSFPSVEWGKPLKTSAPTMIDPFETYEEEIEEYFRKLDLELGI